MARRYPMTPLDPTATIRRHTMSGRLQVWEAKSRDGVWAYIREESAGTPWLIVHIPTDRWLMSVSLPEARRCTASGEALDALDRKTTPALATAGL